MPMGIWQCKDKAHCYWLRCRLQSWSHRRFCGDRWIRARGAAGASVAAVVAIAHPLIGGSIKVLPIFHVLKVEFSSGICLSNWSIEHYMKIAWETISKFHHYWISEMGTQIIFLTPNLILLHNLLDLSQTQSNWIKAKTLAANGGVGRLILSKTLFADQPCAVK